MHRLTPRPNRRPFLAALCALALLPLPLLADDDEAEWSVAEPPIDGFYDVEIDVDEGTWINLDVSPDGREVVFDLLGDLYLIPIDGGDATALTSGLAWDMQPRFSPDGTEIAFTSDRGGGDNIWVIDRDGGEPRQISDEDYRLPNSPAWSSDGEYIAARKHFTSRRSLGTGEIWLWHRSGGGSGLQLNEKPNEQKDLGEPAFSPDGRYVYFSQDTTPGGVFEYSKDSNAEIYTIRRIDRETGDIDTVVSGNGGAVRPTPSPDGRWLAFVRRERFQSKLFVHDLESGRNVKLYDHLDRDMQEIWAIHGVYPQMAWTPDSRSIVFWAGGKIRRIDLGTREVAEIPFRVRQTHRLREALRFPVEVHPERFETRMLRWPTVSPQGDRVVFQALGRLWIRDLPDGEARRLTSQNDHFELYPSWSRDGRSIVYVSWDDEQLGAVRQLAIDRSGDSRVLTQEPGHYVEPVLSPDERTLVYRQIGGGYLTSDLWSKEPGLYALRLDEDDAEPRRLAPRGSQPHFADDSDRVYFTVFEDWDDRHLKSMRLDGSEQRDHATSELATEMRVSPDGRWLAFVERFDAFVTPVPAAAKPIAIGPEMSALPVKRLSDVAGEFLHWSGDSERLHWSIGPELYSQELRRTFAFLADSQLDDEAEPSSIDLGFTVASDVPQGTVAFVGAQVLTMTGEDASGADVLERGTVVVRDNRIVAVGPVGEVDVPAGAYRVDASGKTVMPGLIDVHWHGGQGRAEIVPEQNWENDAGLGFGVTTIHDPSNDTSTIFAAAEMARAGIVRAPRIFSTGTILYGASGDFKAIVDGLDDAREHVSRLQRSGAISVKSYNQPRRDQRQMIVKAADELGMMVVNEGGALFNANMSMVADGHTGIEHSLSVGAIYDDVLQFWGQTTGPDGVGVGNTPTLGVAFGGIEGERYWYQHTDVWANERLLSFVPREMVDARARRRTMAPEEDYNHFLTARLTKQLQDAGVSIQMGAHGQREGLAAHWEMWMFEQGGMTPMEALRAGTVNGARYLGLEGLGTLEAGALADVIVIDGDPLTNLRDSEKVTHTMVNGRLYDAATLDQLAPERRERAPYWWQEREDEIDLTTSP